MSNQTKIREEITQRIVAALEKDLLPWRRMWSTSNAGRHTNVVSKKPYSGVNPMLLEMHALEFGFQSKWWGTFRQWHDLGCFIKRRPDHVPPGQWGCGIVVYLPITKEVVVDPVTGEEEEEKYWVLKRFTLFNAEQAEGEAAERYQTVELPATAEPDFCPADDLIVASGAEIRYGGDQACYCRPAPEGSWPNHEAGDFIVVPHKSCFEKGAYYATILHELGHWSEVRLGWDHNKETYAMGELVAEISSCYLAAELSIRNAEPLENHAAYVKNWLQAMRNDASYIFKASKQASKVCDFLLGFVRQTETKPKPELIEAA